MSIQRMSGRPSARDVSMTDCRQWEENPLVNPRTGNSITPANTIYKTYQKNCFNIWVKSNFNDINALEIVIAKIKEPNFIYTEEFQQDINTIINTLETSLASQEHLNSSVKEIYLKYLIEVKNEIIRLIHMRSVLSNRSPTTTLPVPELGIPTVTLPASSVGTPLGALLEPYRKEIDIRKSFNDVYPIKGPKNSIIDDELKNMIQNINQQIKFLRNHLMGDFYLEDPYYSNEEFIELLIHFINILMMINKYFVRYDQYSSSRKEYKQTSIYYMIRKWIHVFIENFDYITPFKNIFNKFLQYKLSKVTNNNPKGNTFVRPLTVVEIDEYIKQIKGEFIMEMELEDVFDTPENRDKLIHALNTNTTARTGEIKEVYETVLKFILYDVDYSLYPRRLKDSVIDKKRVSVHVKKSLDRAPRFELPENITDKCKILLSSVHPEYKEFQNKIQKACSVITKQCKNLNDARKAIISKYKIREPSSTADISVEDINIKNVSRKHALATLFKRWYSYKNPSDRKEFWTRYFNVTFKGEPGIFLGPGRELIQVCLNNLNSDLGDIFIPSDDGTRRVIINTKFKPTDKFLEKANITTLTGEYKQAILEFIGGLFSRALLLNIDIPYSLSYYTLSYMYYENNISNTLSILYYLLDTPTASTNYFKLLEYEPDILSSIYLSFNDEYPLVSEDKEINHENVIEFIQLLARYYLIKGNNTEYKELLDAFSDGFIIKRSFLLDNKIEPRILDKLLNESGGAINDRKLEKMIKRCLIYETSTSTPEDVSPEVKKARDDLIEHQTKIVDWFTEILNTDGSDFPYEKLGIDKPATLEQQEQFMLADFLPKLLYFWTSSYNINLAEKYVIKFYESDNPKKLPTAHTCVRTIDIPSSYTSYEELFEKLATAVYNTQGFAFAGGVKNMVNKCIQLTLNKGKIEKDYNKAIRYSVIEIIKCHQHLSKKQKQYLIKYINEQSIDFKKADSRKIKQWSKNLCKQVKML